MKKNFFYAFLMLCWIPFVVLANGIKGFSIPQNIHSASLFQDHLFLATDGGIRVLNPEVFSKLYTASDGLEETSFLTVVANEDFVYAISKNALILKTDAALKPFQVVNRSFVSLSSELIPSIAIVNQWVLVLGFNDKLAFIDLNTDRSIISLHSIAGYRLTSNPITALYQKGDSLFVALGTNVFVRKMDWKNLSNDVLLANPDSWKKWRQNPRDTVRAMTWGGDSLVFSPHRGTFEFNPKGEKTQAALGLENILLEGKSYKDPQFITDKKSEVEWVLKYKDAFYLIGPNKVILKNKSGYIDFSTWDEYRLGAVFQILPMVSGGVLAVSTHDSIAYSNGISWADPVLVNFTPYSSELSAIEHHTKSVSVDRNGNMIYSLWGGGYILQRNNGFEFFKWIEPKASCIEEFLDYYIVSTSSTVAPDESGFLVSYWGKEKYGFAYIDLEGNVSCANNIGSTPHSGVLKARFSPEDPNEWLLYSSAASTQVPTGSGALDVFSFRSPAKSGGRLTEVQLKTYKMANEERIVDLDFDATGRLWGLGHRSLAYLEPFDTEFQSPQKINSYSGASNSSIQVDVQGNLWVGGNQGLYRFHLKNASPDTLETLHFKESNGLLSNEVYDIGIDSVLGMLWVAHDLGVTRMLRKELRSAEKFMTPDAPQKPLVYPNPFLKKQHEKIVIDYVPESAHIQVFNSGGSLVKVFKNQDLEGGRVEWNLLDKNGKLLAPGLYHYFIKDGTKLEKGKILIIH